LIKDYDKENIAGCFSCSYSLYYKNNFIISTNGKGINSLYANASGLAEMYERFCNFYFLKSQNLIFEKEYTKIKNIPTTNLLNILPFDYLKDYINLN